VKSERPRLPFVRMGFVFVACLSITAWYAERPVEQPYPYNHAVHTATADCTLCHRGARDGVRAGLPDMQVCTRCHATPPGKQPSADDEALWKRAAAGDPVPWNRLYRLPSHLYFSHRRHTTVAGIECERCHDAMGKRTSPPSRPLRSLKMSDCIDCHEETQVTVDCTACHR